MFRPMLAPGNDPLSYPNYFEELKFPLLVSPKLDGIRCIVKDGICKSRSLKDIPNLMIQDIFSNFNNFDGELISGEPTAHDVYNRTQSVVMSRDKDASDVKLYVFDYADEAYCHHAFENRLMIVKEQIYHLSKTTPNLIALEHKLVYSLNELLIFEEDCLEKGYEGVMMKHCFGRYKHGRGTWKEGLIYKLKRFQDDEGVVVGFVERLRNTNVVQQNELGRSFRSDTKDAKEPMGMVGKFLVKFGGEVIEVAPGKFTHEELKEIWENHDDFLNSKPLLKFRHFPIGVKDKPRFPRAIGFRDRSDL